MNDCIFQAQALNKRFRLRHSSEQRKKDFLAVSKVDFSLFSGKTLGLIGESGSGKSTLAKICAGLLMPDSGKILFNGAPFSLKNKDFRKSVQIVFQNPMGSLNPRMKVKESLLEPQIIHGQCTLKGREGVVDQLLESVGLPTYYAEKYPHMLSGGECQRIAIARVLGLDPKVLILDEVVSALDVIVRAQILNLLLELQERIRIAYLFISHDLAVIRHMSDDIAVMDHGILVEQGSAEQILSHPQHLSTRNMIEASV